MANHVTPWEDEQGWTHNNYPNGHNFPEMLCSLSRYLGYPQCIEYATKIIQKMKSRCIKCTFIYHLTRTELTSCKKPALPSEKLTRQPPSQHLSSCVKGTQENWIMLQFHTCLSITRQMVLGEFGI